MRLISLFLCLSLASAALADPATWRAEWPDTDFSRTSVADWSQIQSGGPPKDGIPALSDPEFIAVANESRIGDREPVIAVEIAGAKPRAYPIRYLTWHEIVNDTVGGVPVAVTFCPLCNSGMVFDRRAKGRTLHFGVTGQLRKSDMVMYDHETQSWWQQAIGQGIVGDMTGVQLKQVTTWTESWRAFRDRNPDGMVMDAPKMSRPYGRNPYRGYDGARRPFLYDGQDPPHGIPPLMRVVRVGGRAWPLTRFRDARDIREAGLVLSWAPGQASALDTERINKGRDVGTIRVRDANGRDVAHDVMFAFAFDAFWPDGTWMLGE